MADEQTPSRWQELTGGRSGEEYAARFDALAREGTDVHGEADLCAALAGPGARVLDAGCGTGRVAIRLAELGFDCVGVDADASMLAVARDRAPGLPWLEADLATLDVTVLGSAAFDLVVLAGNVVPLLAPGTLPAAVAGLAGVLRPGGLLVAGFGLDADHLPPGCPVTPLADHDEACAAAGLVPVERWSTWQRAAYDESEGYVVAVHRRA